MSFDPGSILSTIEDWYDNYYIFIGIGVLVFIILIMVILLLYYGVSYGIKQF